MSDLIVAKIGGSTLGAHDTTLADIAELQRRGNAPVVVHGGGAVVSDWLSRLNLPTRFERGVRVTDEQAVEVVVAVLAGLVNKRLVASLEALGAAAVGLSGADGRMLSCRIADPELGYVGEIVAVDPAPVVRVLLAGGIPVLAPIGLLCENGNPTGQLVNINADTAAGAIAAALRARWLIFLTDVPGVQRAGKTLERLSAAEADNLVGSQVIEGGMIPKVEACVAAARAGCTSMIADGREKHKLLAASEGRAVGTLVG